MWGTHRLWFRIEKRPDLKIESTFADRESSQRTLFELQEVLYLSGARNFLFIDVPPIDRSPIDFGMLFHYQHALSF